MSDRRSILPLIVGLIGVAGIGWWIARPQAPAVREHGGVALREHAGKEHAGAALKEHAGKEHGGIAVTKEHGGQEHGGATVTN